MYSYRLKPGEFSTCQVGDTAIQVGNGTDARANVTLKSMNAVFLGQEEGFVQGLSVSLSRNDGVFIGVAGKIAFLGNASGKKTIAIRAKDDEEIQVLRSDLLSYEARGNWGIVADTIAMAHLQQRDAEVGDMLRYISAHAFKGDDISLGALDEISETVAKIGAFETLKQMRDANWVRTRRWSDDEAQKYTDAFTCD